MSRRASRAHWRARGGGDSYSRQAAARGLGSRAWFKLESLDARFKLVRPGRKVLELGAAPGGWTRYLAAKKAHVFACDQRHMEVPAKVAFLQTDVGGEAFRDWSMRHAPFGLIVSDMAPDISGIDVRDMAAAEALVDLAFDLADALLDAGGDLVVKLFQGDPVTLFGQRAGAGFSTVKIAKPRASRSESSEMYGVALNKRKPLTEPLVRLETGSQ
ncbi:MAG: FtsJ-like methyltransferase family protein [Gammaproteobacteria bacterium]|nr:FtsJ-like methyltransferase family protein [Gammaproteobacteria bacterium]MCY4278804.1 FtsJ-like methyltransferase family protein [Gammaproteobacteria bacterium]